MPWSFWICYIAISVTFWSHKVISFKFTNICYTFTAFQRKLLKKNAEQNSNKKTQLLLHLQGLELGYVSHFFFHFKWYATGLGLRNLKRLMHSTKVAVLFYVVFFVQCFMAIVGGMWFVNDALLYYPQVFRHVYRFAPAPPSPLPQSSCAKSSELWCDYYCAAACKAWNLFLSCFSWSCVAAVSFLLPCIIMRSYALCQQVVAVLLPVLNRASYECVSIPFESWASCSTLGFVDSTLCSFLKIWNVRMLSVLCWIVGHHSRSLGAYVIAFDVQKICYGCYGFAHVIKHEILFRFGLFLLRRWGVNLISSTCGYSQGKVKFITARKSRKNCCIAICL